MMSLSHNDLREAISVMPFPEQVAMLVCIVIKRNEHDPFVACNWMIRITELMTQDMSTTNRFRIAEAFRDAADATERRTQQVEIS